MTIRKTLLLAFLIVGLAPAILLASLAFVKAGEAVQAEIEANLAVQAAGISANLDKMMFERLQNAAVWSRLDIMQDLQIHDVDKRLSRFLADLQAGYHDVFVNLSCTDPQGLIVSSSEARVIGLATIRNPAWQKTALSGTQVTMELPSSGAGASLLMRVPIASAFASGELGELRLTLDWSELYRLLDEVAGESGRMLAIVDHEGRLIAASADLRERGLLLGQALAGWKTFSARRSVSVRAGQPISQSAVIVGSAASRGYGQFPGFGWTTLVIQPVDQALKPIHRMALIFLGLLAAITVLIFASASWVSREIARPIIALTAFARGYMRTKVLQAPPAASAGVGAVGEVAELSASFVQMVRDIDQSQQNLVRASKLAVVGEMSSVIAHEVRTPLGIMRSSAQMLQRESSLSDEGRELLGFIDGETERLNRLVSAMLDTARPRAPSYGQVDVHELVRKSVAMLAAQMEKKKVSVEEILLADNPVVECDEEQMTQVLLNLLMNGLQILDHGGRIEVSSHDEGDALRIDIADDGPGIDPSERASVFEAFFFKREGGVGLGLAIVQQIVVSHGGDIEAMESRLGGALFRIRLPRKQSGGS